MAKQIKGSCTRCALCGCWDRPEANGKKWCKGLPEHVFKWYEQHPELEEEIFRELRQKIDAEETSITVSGKGDFSFKHRSDVGVCVSDTDKSCPFLDQGIGKACKIWGTDRLPIVCATTPQNLIDEDQIDQWVIDHPQCGFYWTDV